MRSILKKLIETNKRAVNANTIALAIAQRILYSKCRALYKFSLSAFWNYYTDDITWPATYITVANMLYTQYGDKRAIEKHYASMVKWANHIVKSYVKEGLITKDKYGDWCVPPESLELIHAKDSTRITSGGLIATAYFYQLMQYKPDNLADSAGISN